MAAEQLEAVTGNNDCLVAQGRKPHENPDCRKLLRAALAGNWNAATAILQDDNNLVRAHITYSGETVLHIVAGAAEKNHVDFVRNLLKKTNKNDLEITNNYGSTALHYAALAGNLAIASLLVNKNGGLPSKANNGGVTPLYMAALSAHNDMVEYLLRYTVFVPQTNAVYGCTILNTCITTGLYGVASQIVARYNFLAVAKDEKNEGPLDVLARKPSAFVGERGEFWQKVTRNQKSQQTEVSLLLNQMWDAVEHQRDIENSVTEDIEGLLFVAAEKGNYEFLVHLLHRYPDLLYKVDDSNHSIFHIATLNCYEPIFSLIYEIGSHKYLIASHRQEDETTLLHLAARLSPSCQLEILPGAALQTQRELLWYKEVEKIVPHSYRETRDANGRTPHDLFTEEHKDLMEKGEKWMKKTSQSCMVVATLIATVVFTTAFTIPGGNDDNSGMPIMLGDKFFVVFVISEIIAMLSASTSIIMFLCILTSRYGEQDFLESLPFWLLTGITTLFVSLAAMMIAFCTTFLLFDRGGLANVPTLLGLFALVPLMFLWFKYPLLVDILSSTYGSSYLFQSRRRLL